MALQFVAYSFTDSYGAEYAIKYPSNMYLNAVKKNGLALQFSKKQNIKICFSAVQQNNNAIKYVNDINMFKYDFITFLEKIFCRFLQHNTQDYLTPFVINYLF